eukprot:gene16899-17086_t
MSDHFNQRLDFMGLDTAARAHLRKQKPMIERIMRPALNAFYDRVRRTPVARAYFRDDNHMQKALEAQMRHWSVLASGDMDERYLEGAKRVGQMHSRIGLPPNLYIGAYTVIVEHLMRSAIDEAWPKGLAGLRLGNSGPEELKSTISSMFKAAMVDMDIVLSEYMDAAQAEQARLESIAHDQAKVTEDVVGALGDALSMLKSGDLTHRLREPFSEAYEPIRHDLNAVMEQLQTIMSKVAASTQGVSAGAEEIGAAADDLSRRTEQQAASLEQTAAALDQITATVRRTAEGAKQASKTFWRDSVADTARAGSNGATNGPRCSQRSGRAGAGFMAKRDLSGAIDFAHLETYTGADPDLTEEVLSIFVEQSALWMRLLAPNAPATSWRDAAHTMKGAALGIGAHALAKAPKPAQPHAQPSWTRSRPP